MNKNILSRMQYLISEKLHTSLMNEHLEGESRSMSKDKLGIYLVVFRVLNNGKKDVLYNYIYYPNIFTETYLNFLVGKNVASIRYSEWGDLLVIINQDIFDNLPNKDVRVFDNSWKYSVNDTKFVENLLTNPFPYYRGSNTLEVINILKRLNYLTVDYKEMSQLLTYTIEKNYYKFAYNLINDSDLEVYKNRISIEDNDLNVNLINSVMFVVRDINSFISSLKTNTNYTFNEGNQQWRGQVNSMNALLNSMDHDYRNSLYNHNQYHVKSGTLDMGYKLDKSKFSFRNIHMNLGNIRWYSTNRKVVKASMSAKLSERLTKRKSFKVESQIYQHLSRFLKNSPLNENTEIAIENFLLNYYNNMPDTSNKESTTLIKYELFSNKDIKKHIYNSIEILEEYLNKFRSKTYKSEPKNKKIDRGSLSKYYFNLILNNINNSIVIELCLGIIARVISNYNKPNNECLAINVCIDMGDVLVKTYYYSLYKLYIQKILKDFMIKYKEFVINKDDINEDLKNNLLDKLSNLESKYDKLEVYDLKYMIKNSIDLDLIADTNLDEINLILDYTLSSWKLDNKSVMNNFEVDDTMKLHIGSILVDWLIESDLIQNHLVSIGRKDRRTYLIPATKIINILTKEKSNHLRHLPFRIPMIVKPKLYSRELVNGQIRERLGGYLINDVKVTDKMIIRNWELKKSSIVQDPNVVYDLVNNINSVGFKINKDMLNFIYTYGEKFELLLNEDINFDFSKPINKTDYTEIESYVSKLDLQDNILGLAELYSNIPEFYIPVRIDERGRMNCVNQYLNYQSTELAKSLLLFSKAELLHKNDTKAINYLKAYGANCFGNKLDKKSWVERSKWTDDNLQDIINYTNGKLIKQADNKLLFVAFCIEYNKWLKSYDNIESYYFETHLPIQLDATCNGYQHLSLLISDYDMAKELNLTKSDMNDTPKDYYGFMLIKLTDLFKSKLSSNNLSKELKDSYERLSKLLLGRSTIKKAIMTIPYNVSLLQMIKYIKENFIRIKDQNSKENSSAWKLEFQYKDDPSIILSHQDISLIASGLKEVLEINFPRLKFLIIYLKTLAKICNKLNLYIPWGTSSGLLVNHSYVSSKEIKLRPFSFEKSSFSLNVPTDKLNGNKQIRAFMPNLIHSLDAAALALLVHYYFNNGSNVHNFYAIHDCFAVTANNIEMNMNYLKVVYKKIYSEDDYLRKLDREILQHIKYHYGDDCYNEETKTITVNLDGVEIKEKFPNVNIVLGTELPTHDYIIGSSYLMH